MTETTKVGRDELRDDPHPQPEDVRRVIDDADRLATIERRVRELADWWDERARNAGHNEGGGKVRECAKELRALIDTENEGAQ